MKTLLTKFLFQAQVEQTGRCRSGSQPSVGLRSGCFHRLRSLVGYINFASTFVSRNSCIEPQRSILPRRHLPRSNWILGIESASLNQVMCALCANNRGLHRPLLVPDLYFVTSAWCCTCVIMECVPSQESVALSRTSFASMNRKHRQRRCWRYMQLSLGVI